MSDNHIQTPESKSEKQQRRKGIKNPRAWLKDQKEKKNAWQIYIEISNGSYGKLKKISLSKIIKTRKWERNDLRMIAERKRALPSILCLVPFHTEQYWLLPRSKFSHIFFSFFFFLKFEGMETAGTERIREKGERTRFEANTGRRT